MKEYSLEFRERVDYTEDFRIIDRNLNEFKENKDEPVEPGSSFVGG